MDEIKDSTGRMISISRVKRLIGGIHGARVSGLYHADSEGPFHLRFETVDGELLSSQDFPDQETAYAKLAELRASVEELSTGRQSGPRQT